MTNATTEEKKTRSPCVKCGGPMEGEPSAAKSCAACRGETVDPKVGKPVATKDTAIKLDPKLLEAVSKPALPTKEYWIGTLSTCPIQNVTCGGYSFPLYTGRLTTKGDWSQEWTGLRGIVVKLTEKEVDRIKIAVAQRMVRKVGNRGSLFILGSPHYQRDPEDEPLAKYVYMHEIGETVPRDFRQGDPEPML